MEQRLTNKQILGRLRAEFRGWQVEPVARGHQFRIRTPSGREFTDRFDRVRNPVELQKVVASIRRSLV